MSFDSSSPTAGASVLTGAQAPSSSSGGAVTSVDGATGVVTSVASVATFAALGSLVSGGFTEGKRAYVQSAKADFVLKKSSLATRTNFRIAASGLAGYQWVRQLGRDAYWEVQATWNIDPTNASGLASDDNSGVDATHPLLTYQECSWRLFLAELNQVTTLTCGPGNQQAGDNPTFSFIPRAGNNGVKLAGVPTVVYTSTVTSYVAAAFGSSAADDNELGDTAVPGGSFTAAGALATGVLVKRTSGTVIYAGAIKDLGTTTLRVGQPVNPASVSSNVAFAPGDTYQVISLPSITSMAIMPWSTNLGTQLSLLTWNVPANGSAAVPSISFVTCYVEKLVRNCGENLAFTGCVFDIPAGASFEGGGVTTTGILNGCCFKGSGATRYSFSGTVTSENGVTCFQGAVVLMETGVWNGGQLNFYDTTTNAFTTGTGGRGHFLTPTPTVPGTINGKGNTSKLLAANQSSQIVCGAAISTGNMFTAASTSDANPILSGTTASNVAIPLDANMNGVFQTA